jgi:hypothetical protein
MGISAKRSADGLYVLVMVASAAGGVYLLIRLVLQLIRIAGNHDIPVDAGFDRTVPVPIGDVSAPVDITSGIVYVSDAPAFSLGLLLLGELLASGAPVALLAMLGVFCLRMTRERVFDRVNSRLVSGAGAIIAVGGGVGPFIAHMGSNGALAVLSGHTLGRTDNPGTVDWTAVGVGFALIVLGYAFEVGVRLKRETEGLV